MMETDRKGSDHGADVNARDQNGLTPLCDAARRGHVEFTQMLLEHGTVINARDNDGRFSLHTAVYEGNIQVAGLLLEHSADVNARAAPRQIGRDPFPVHDKTGDFRTTF